MLVPNLFDLMPFWCRVWQAVGTFLDSILFLFLFTWTADVCGLTTNQQDTSLTFNYSVIALPIVISSSMKYDKCFQGTSKKTNKLI